MSNLLAGIYSKADSLKRALNNAFSEPLGYAAQTIGYGIDRLNEQTADMMTAASGSVLVSSEQKAAASKRSTDRVANTVAGAGIIVPLGAIPGMTRARIAEASEQLKSNPAAAYINYGAHRQPVTGAAVKNISDKGQLIDGKHTLEVAGKHNLLAGKAGVKVDQLIDVSRYPPDLQEYFKSLGVYSQDAPGASFSQTGRVTLGPADSQEELTSYLLHELQHGSQYLYDMPRGGNPQQFFQDYGKFSTAKIRGEQLLEGLQLEGKVPKGDIAAFSKAQGSGDILSNPDALNSVLGMLKKVDNKAQSQYENIAGEVEARLVQKYYERKQGEILGIPDAAMRNSLRINPATVFNPNSVAQMPKVDADPVTQSLINMLLGN